MTAEQRKTVYGLAKGLKINDEELHVLINGLTGFTSLKELSDSDAKKVISELRERMKLKNRNEPLEKRKPNAYRERVPGMMTPEQQSLAWRLMYRLQELDEKPFLNENGKPVKIGKRMAGAILRATGNNMAYPGRDIFKCVHDDEGEKLIEFLKRYVRSAERKAARRTAAE